MIRAITNVVKGAVAGALGVELTRGGVVAATLEATVSGSPIKVACHFNPTDLTISKTASYEPVTIKGSDIPDVHFNSLTPDSITLNLWFDSTTTLAMDNIRKVTDKLWNFIRIDQSQADDKSHVARPPDVTFKWEQFEFTGVVKSMTHKYTLFNEWGAPLRAYVTLTLEQTVDKGLPEVQTSAAAMALRAAKSGVSGVSSIMSSIQSLSAGASIVASTSTNSSSSKKPSTTGGVSVQEGTRIDHVAAATTGNSGNQRKVAENNNIDNPMKLPKGQVIN